MVTKIGDYIDGQWRDDPAREHLKVTNPASAAVIGEVLLSPKEVVAQAVDAGYAAFLEWRRVPVGERIQPLFKLKYLLDEHIEELAQIITNECGKTFKESMGELRRGIENVEVACGMPSLIQGYNNEDIASGIDEHMMRQPLGVTAAITPFNFPGMIP